MDEIDLKKLAALAKTCRKAGIATFEGGGISFTLKDQIDTRTRRSAKRSAKAPVDLGDNEVESDEISAEDLLFWSSTPPAES